jgi:hypothetical protein
LDRGHADFLRNVLSAVGFFEDVILLTPHGANQDDIGRENLGFEGFVFLRDPRPIRIGIGVCPLVQGVLFFQKPALARPGVRDRVNHANVILGGNGRFDGLGVFVDGVGRIDFQNVKPDALERPLVHVGIEGGGTVFRVDHGDSLSHAGGDQ